MIGLSNSVKDEMLGAFARRMFLLALYSGDNEIVDAMYARRTVEFSGPVGSDTVRYVQNVDTVLFEGFNSPHQVDHWAIIDNDGTVKARYRLTDPLEVSPVMDCKFRAGDLRIGLP